MAAFSSSSSSSSTMGRCLRRSSLQSAACVHTQLHTSTRCRSSRLRLATAAAATQHVVAPLLQQQQEQGLLRRRAGIIAAAGRPRRQQQPQPSPDDEPQLDMDDVMYNTEDMEGEEGLQDLEEAEDEGAEPAGAIGLDDSPRRIVYLDDAEEFGEDDYEFGDEDEQEEEAEAQGADEELEGWDAALSNFDTAQDASAPAAPTKEEREAAAAAAMVRFQVYEEDAGEGPTLEVVPAPVPAQWRAKTFDEQTVDLAAADKEALARNRQGYAVFPMYNMELLVSELTDGRMVLADAFVLNTFDELFSRPAISDEVPRDPRMFQLLPWEHTNTGDTLKRIDPKVTLMRMYFVGVSSMEPYDIDMSQVYSFDCIDRSFVRHKVTTLGEDHVDPVLRIREDGIFIEDAALVPGMAFVAEGFAGHPEEQYTNPDKEFNIRDYVRMGLWPEPGLSDEQRALLPPLSVSDEVAQQEAIEERLEELELMEELDDMPDVPAIDMV